MVQLHSIRARSKSWDVQGFEIVKNWGAKESKYYCCGHHCFECTSIPKIQPKLFTALGLEQFLNFGTLSFFLY